MDYEHFLKHIDIFFKYFSGSPRPLGVTPRNNIHMKYTHSIVSVEE